MVELLILSSGDEAVTLNNQIILTGDPAHDEVGKIEEVAANLARITGLILVKHHMATPAAEDWSWEDVLAVRGLTFGSITPSQVMVEFVAVRGVEIDISDNGGWYFHYDDQATGLPEMYEDSSTSTDFPTKEEATIAAYEWIKGVDRIKNPASSEYAVAADEARFFRTTVTTSFLSEDASVTGWDLEDLVRESQSGSLVMEAQGAAMMVLSPAEMAHALGQAGSEPAFFELNADGSSDGDDAPGDSESESPI